MTLSRVTLENNSRYFSQMNIVYIDVTIKDGRSIMQLEDVPRTHGTETKTDRCFIKLLPSSGWCARLRVKCT